jgi:hypothetical protein
MHFRHPFHAPVPLFPRLYLEDFKKTPNFAETFKGLKLCILDMLRNLLHYKISMDKILMIFLLSITIGCSESHNNQKSQEYIYLGTRHTEYELFRQDTISKNYNGVYTRANGVVVDANTAVTIGRAVLVPIYGEEEIDLQRPYKVELVNDTIWMLYGSLPQNANGGCFEIAINKKDGRIMKIGHGK